MGKFSSHLAEPVTSSEVCMYSLIQVDCKLPRTLKLQTNSALDLDRPLYGLEFFTPDVRTHTHGMLDSLSTYCSKKGLLLTIGLFTS